MEPLAVRVAEGQEEIGKTDAIRPKSWGGCMRDIRNDSQGFSRKGKLELI